MLVIVLKATCRLSYCMHMQLKPHEGQRQVSPKVLSFIKKKLIYFVVQNKKSSPTPCKLQTITAVLRGKELHEYVSVPLTEVLSGRFKLHLPTYVSKKNPTNDQVTSSKLLPSNYKNESCCVVSLSPKTRTPFQTVS